MLGELTCTSRSPRAAHPAAIRADASTLARRRSSQRPHRVGSAAQWTTAWASSSSASSSPSAPGATRSCRTPSTPAARGPRPPAGGLEEARLHRLGLVTALAIGLHNVPEGFVTFAGTLQDPRVGVALAVAMAVHNIPEGVAVAVPVRQATGSRTKAFGWAAFTGATEPVGALALWLLLAPFLTPVLLGAVYAGIAGVMTAVSLAGLLPAARAAGGWRPTLAGATAGALVMAASLWMLG